MKTRDEATLELAVDILADPDWTTRVVVAAIVAEHQLGQGTDSSALTGARDTLWSALTQKVTP